MSIIRVGKNFIKIDLFCKYLEYVSIDKKKDKKYGYLGKMQVTCHFDSYMSTNKIMSQKFSDKSEAEEWIETYLMPRYEEGFSLLKKDEVELEKRIESLEESLKFMAGGEEYTNAKRDFESKAEELPHKKHKTKH